MNQKTHTGGNGARLRRRKEATGTGPQATGFWELTLRLISGVLNILLGNRRQRLGIWGFGFVVNFFTIWNWRQFWEIGLVSNKLVLAQV